MEKVRQKGQYYDVHFKMNDRHTKCGKDMSTNPDEWESTDKEVNCKNCLKWDFNAFKEIDKAENSNNSNKISNYNYDLNGSDNKFKFPLVSIVFYLLGFASIFAGFYKMLVYENPESLYLDKVNVYVGGDAYNYIINANYFVGFNVLGLSFIVIATSIVITSAILFGRK